MSDDRDPPVDPFPARPEGSPFPPLGPEYGGALEPEPATDWNQQADAHDLATRGGRLAAIGRFAFPPEPPIDDEGLAARDRRWASRVIVFAALFLAVFNAPSMQNWARQQAPGWATTTVERLADVWAEQIALLGADRPKQAVHDATRALQDQRFVGTAER